MFESILMMLEMACLIWVKAENSNSACCLVYIVPSLQKEHIIEVGYLLVHLPISHRIERWSEFHRLFLEQTLHSNLYYN